MRFLCALFTALFPLPALACGLQVCLVSPDSHVDDVLTLDGAQIGEHFAGQQIVPNGPHDALTGRAFDPLQMRAGPDGQNLSVVHFSGSTVINGYGVAGFPKRDGQGEGAMAVLFDVDQSAFGFDLRGGEAGQALIHVFARNGQLIATVPVDPTGEFALALLRTGGAADMAGFVITNTDPQGLAIDTIRFGKPPDVS